MNSRLFMKSALQNTFIGINLLLLINIVAIAQVDAALIYTDPKSKLGPNSASPRFERLQREEYGYNEFHHFKPKKNKTKFGSVT